MYIIEQASSRLSGLMVYAYAVDIGCAVVSHIGAKPLAVVRGCARRAVRCLVTGEGWDGAEVRQCRRGWRLTPATQFHPAEQRFQRHNPQNTRDQVKNGLRQYGPFSHPWGQAGNGDRPDQDQPKDHENSGWFAPAWLLLILVHVVRPPQLIYSCSVKMESSGISVVSQAIWSTS